MVGSDGEGSEKGHGGGGGGGVGWGVDIIFIQKLFIGRYFQDFPKS